MVMLAMMRMEYVVEMFTKSGLLKVWPHKGTAIPVTWAPPVAFLEREDFFQNLIVKKPILGSCPPFRGETIGLEVERYV